MKDIVLTFDIDWASDAVIQFVLDELIEKQIKSTWFITHNFPLLEKMKSRPDLFELGIHPNFLPGTTQGDTDDDILNNLLRILPQTELIRMHSVYQSGPLLSKIVKGTPIKIDSSIFLPEMSHIQIVTHLTPYGALKRVPVFWADDYELLKNETDWEPKKYFSVTGLKVFLFHPVHIAWNTFSHKQYEEYKKKGGENIPTSTEPYQRGVAFFYSKLIDEVSKYNNSVFLKDLI